MLDFPSEYGDAFMHISKQIQAVSSKLDQVLARLDAAAKPDRTDEILAAYAQLTEALKGARRDP
jgi:hypothetical protein